MGAEFVSFRVDGKATKAEVEQRFKREQDDASYENGNSYSGSINMARGLKFDSREFNSHSEAEEYLSETCQKWENAIAVRYKSNNKLKESAKLIKLRNRYDELTTQFRELENSIRERVKAKLTAVEFISCSGCKSRLDTRFKARTLRCPVCEASFASKVDAARRVKLEATLTDVRQKIADETKVLQTKADKTNRESHWLIAAWCSS